MAFESQQSAIDEHCCCGELELQHFPFQFCATAGASDQQHLFQSPPGAAAPFGKQAGVPPSVLGQSWRAKEAMTFGRMSLRVADGF
jgi:hypothetical protein